MSIAIQSKPVKRNPVNGNFWIESPVFLKQSHAVYFVPFYVNILPDIGNSRPSRGVRFLAD